MADSSVRVLLALNRVCARGASETTEGGTHGREPVTNKEGAMETEWRHTVQWSQRGYFIVDRSKKYEQAPYLTRRALISDTAVRIWISSWRNLSTRLPAYELRDGLEGAGASMQLRSLPPQAWNQAHARLRPSGSPCSSAVCWLGRRLSCSGVRK